MDALPRAFACGVTRHGEYRAKETTLFSCGFTASAETEETGRLASITRDFAKCADVALANFPSDQEAQKAIKIFYSEMIKNIQKMVELEQQASDENLEFFINLMGKEVLTGYMLKGFTNVDSVYQSEKKELMKKHDWDWKRVDKELWSKQGCNTIYNSIHN